MIRNAALCIALAMGSSIFAHRAAAQAALDDAHDRQARSLFEAGREAYTSGEYESALRFFQQSYELSHRSVLLFNVAQAADRARQDRVALDAYQRYLAEIPNAEQRALVESRIAYFQREIAAQEARDAQSPEPTSTTTPTEMTTVETTTTTADATPRGADTTLGWIIVGAGGAVTVVGAVLLGLGLSNASSVENARDGALWRDLSGPYEQAQPMMIAGGVLAGVGVAAIATGVVLVVTAPSSGSDSTTVSFGPGSIAVRGSF